MVGEIIKEDIISKNTALRLVYLKGINFYIIQFVSTRIEGIEAFDGRHSSYAKNKAIKSYEEELKRQRYKEQIEMLEALWGRKMKKIMIEFEVEKDTDLLEFDISMGGKRHTLMRLWL